MQDSDDDDITARLYIQRWPLGQSSQRVNLTPLFKQQVVSVDIFPVNLGKIGD